MKTCAGELGEEIAGLGLTRELGKGPGTRCCDRPERWEPELDCIRLRSVGCRQHRMSRRFTQEAWSAPCAVCRDRLERLDHHQDHDDDQQNRRYLVDNTIEFLRARVAVMAEFVHPAGK